MSVNVWTVMLPGFISSKNVASKVAVRGTPVPPFVGETVPSVGAVLSTLTVTELEADEVLPCASVALAV